VRAVEVARMAVRVVCHAAVSIRAFVLVSKYFCTSKSRTFCSPGDPRRGGCPPE
jgi:hypothetical protein